MAHVASPDTAKLSYPPFLRVEEAAQLLRISRSTAYERANAWLRSGGEAGLPCIRLGRRILIPRIALERWALVGSDQDEQQAPSFA